VANGSSTQRDKIFASTKIVDKEPKMPKPSGDFLALLKEGKVEEVRALLATEKSNSRYAPDTISERKGSRPDLLKRENLSNSTTLENGVRNLSTPIRGECLGQA
jgi:hypothetical protein